MENYYRRKIDDLSGRKTGQPLSMTALMKSILINGLRVMIVLIVVALIMLDW